MLKGFDAEFSSVEDYILRITERIWEGRRLDLINRYYSSDCIVESPQGCSNGTQPVIDGTLATLAEFPDRRLLAEAVLVSGTPEEGYLSSHRIFSPMTHVGAGRFGVPSHKPIYVRTIADCVCRNNRIVHEWLVRDHGSIARQLGLLPSTLAKDWLRAEPEWVSPLPSVAPAPFKPYVDQSQSARSYVAALPNLFGKPDTRSKHDDRTIHDKVLTWHPGGFTSVGAAQRQGRIRALVDGLSFFDLSLESCTLHPHLNPSQHTISVRFRLRMIHNRYGHYGEPTGALISLLCIQHADFSSDKLASEWILIDEISIWMQILAARKSGL